MTNEIGLLIMTVLLMLSIFFLELKCRDLKKRVDTLAQRIDVLMKRRVTVTASCPVCGMLCWRCAGSGRAGE